MNTNSESATRVAVVGGGPGGYEAAIALAKLGAQVTLIEKEQLGGTCLNRGCIPAKTLLAGTQILSDAQGAGDFGVRCEGVGIDFARLAARKEQVVARLRSGVQFLMRKNGVRVIEGEGRFLSSRKLAAHTHTGDVTVDFDAAIIATGSSPAMPPIPGIDASDVIDSTGALALKQVPKRLAVIGGGVIGLELSAVYMRLGARVTILEACPQILPEMDEDIASEYLRLSGLGERVKTRCQVREISDGPDGKRVSYLDGAGESCEIFCDKVLVATGRRAYTRGLGLEGIGVATERGRILVDDEYQTNVPGIYAVGDVNGRAQLAHAATAQGKYAAAVILGKKPAVRTAPVPWCVFTEPELAGVGLSEKQAAKAGIPYRVAQYSFAANGKALSMGKAAGAVKILYGTRYREILGAKLIGPHVTDMVGEIALAITLEATLDELAATMHPHPTLSEALMEAAAEAL